MQLCCLRNLNNAYHFHWRSMGWRYANPPFSQQAKVSTKIALEAARVVLCTPNCGSTGGHAYWRRLLDRMTAGRTELPDGPMYVPGDCQETMPTLEWGSLVLLRGWVGSTPPPPSGAKVLEERKWSKSFDRLVVLCASDQSGAFSLL